MNASCHGLRTADSDSEQLATHPLRRIGCAFLWLFNLFMGCSHQQVSFPFTPVRKNGGPSPTRNGTYVVCLGCGGTFDYDWKEMRMGRPVTARPRIDAPPRRVRV